MLSCSRRRTGLCSCSPQHVQICKFATRAATSNFGIKFQRRNELQITAPKCRTQSCIHTTQHLFASTIRKQESIMSLEQREAPVLLGAWLRSTPHCSHAPHCCHHERWQLVRGPPERNVKFQTAASVVNESLEDHEIKEHSHGRTLHRRKVESRTSKIR